MATPPTVVIEVIPGAVDVLVPPSTAARGNAGSARQKRGLR